MFRLRVLSRADCGGDLAKCWDEPVDERVMGRRRSMLVRQLDSDFLNGIEDRANTISTPSLQAMKLALATLFVTGAAAFQAPSQSARSPIALEATRSEVAAAILGASALFAPVAAFAAR